ncbi:MAG: histidine phosphatase family protein [Clostridia bacterium]|nr:histidine phosphatase family protein [Clostridia bacterium]
MAIQIKYFVHGTTTDNEEKKASGWNEVKLSEKGINQAKTLSETIKNEHFDIVFCSDLERAVQSASIDFANRGIEIIKDSRLRECNYGKLNGKDNKLVVYCEHINEPFPSGESLKDVENRMRNFCDFLKENYDNKKIAIVAHRATQLSLDIITKNITWEKAIEEDWRNTKSWQAGWEYKI